MIYPTEVQKRQINSYFPPGSYKNRIIVLRVHLVSEDVRWARHWNAVKSWYFGTAEQDGTP